MATGTTFVQVCVFIAQWCYQHKHTKFFKKKKKNSRDKNEQRSLYKPNNPSKESHCMHRIEKFYSFIIQLLSEKVFVEQVILFST